MVMAHLFLTRLGKSKETGAHVDGRDLYVLKLEEETQIRKKWMKLKRKKTLGFHPSISVGHPGI